MTDKKLRVLVIGNGNWSKVYKKNIKNNSNFSLISYSFEKIINIDKLLAKIEMSACPDVVIIATHPKDQIYYLKQLISSKVIIVIEKPLCITDLEVNILKNILVNYRNNVIANLPSCFNNEVISLINYFQKHNICTNEIEIFEEGCGPFRRSTSPVYDWYPHVAALLSLFLNKYEINQFYIQRTSLYGVQYSAFGKILGGGGVKISFGNGFSKRYRVLKIKDSNGNNHLINLGKKWAVKESPIYNLLKTVSDKSKNNFKKIYPSIVSDIDFITHNASHTVDIAKKFLNVEGDIYRSAYNRNFIACK